VIVLKSVLTGKESLLCSRRKVVIRILSQYDRVFHDLTTESKILGRPDLLVLLQKVPALGLTIVPSSENFRKTTQVDLNHSIQNSGSDFWIFDFCIAKIWFIKDKHLSEPPSLSNFLPRLWCSRNRLSRLGNTCQLGESAFPFRLWARLEFLICRIV